MGSTAHDDDGTRRYTLDDLKGRTPDEIRDIIDLTKAQIRDLMYGQTGELRDRSDAENTALRVLVEVHESAEKRYEEHRQIKEVLDRKPKAIEFSRLGAQVDDPYADVRRMTDREARDRALRVLDDRVSTAHMSAPQRDEVDKQVRSATDIARRVLVTETEEYRNAWVKLVTQPHPFLDADEARAVKSFMEYRAMSENTTSAGGYGIPVMAAA